MIVGVTRLTRNVDAYKTHPAELSNTLPSLLILSVPGRSTTPS